MINIEESEIRGYLKLIYELGWRRGRSNTEYSQKHCAEKVNAAMAFIKG